MDSFRKELDIRTIGKEHRSIRRIRKIAEVFHTIGLIEFRGAPKTGGYYEPVRKPTCLTERSRFRLRTAREAAPLQEEAKGFPDKLYAREPHGANTP